MIGQQWEFTYRYPQYGNFETWQLAIPVDRPVIFHVTSLDVVHSFWAYQLGVKADAVPGAENLVGTYAKKTGTFDIRCAELCGVWHGQMSAKGADPERDRFRQLDQLRACAGERPGLPVPVQCQGLVPVLDRVLPGSAAAGRLMRRAN